MLITKPDLLRNQPVSPCDIAQVADTRPAFCSHRHGPHLCEGLGLPLCFSTWSLSQILAMTTNYASKPCARIFHSCCQKHGISPVSISTFIFKKANSWMKGYLKIVGWGREFPSLLPLSPYWDLIQRNNGSYSFDRVQYHPEPLVTELPLPMLRLFIFCLFRCPNYDYPIQVFLPSWYSSPKGCWKI